jgi:hypothetical protein
MKRLSLLLFFIIASAAWADEIYLNDGRIFKGKIIQVTVKHIEYDPEGDKPFDILPRGQIQKIVYDDGKILYLYEGKGTQVIEKRDEVITEHEEKRDVKPVAREDKGVQDEETARHRHDGFFLRIHYGFGNGLVVEQDYLGSDREFKGFTGTLRLQIGNEIAENLILFGEFGVFVMQDPDMHWQGESVSEVDAVIAISDLGIGLTYYFMPINIYLSGSLTLSRNSIDLEGVEKETGGGLGVYFSIGKEWWVSENWGIGVALFVYASSTEVENKDLDATFDVYNRVLGIAFTATYN